MDIKFLSRLFCLAVVVVSITACDDFTGSSRLQSPQFEGDPGPRDRQQTKLPPEFFNPNEGSFSDRKMLINIGTEILAKQAESFAYQVPVLKESLEQYCGQLRENFDVEVGRSRVRSDWKRVMLAFHGLEGAPLGPLTDNNRLILESLYSFPYLNACGIDQSVLANGKGEPRSSALLFNVRGLGALEYLLFEDSLKSKCNLRANPELKLWNELPTSDKLLQRCEWAVHLILDIQEKADLLKSQWAVQKGNYTLKMVNGDLYESEREAITALTNSMSQLEFLKEAKLGRPLGQNRDCPTETCPRDVEHVYSGISLDSIEAHLKSFRALFYGSFDPKQKAFGIDDLLVASGRKDVVARMTAALDQVLVGVRASQKLGTLQHQIESFDVDQCRATTPTNRAVEICALYADMSELALIWRTEVLIALSLRAPPSHQGDTD